MAGRYYTHIKGHGPSIAQAGIRDFYPATRGRAGMAVGGGRVPLRWPATRWRGANHPPPGAALKEPVLAEQKDVEPLRLQRHIRES